MMQLVIQIIESFILNICAVYTLNSSNNVEYVGRTSNIEARKSQHRANPYRTKLRMDIVEENISYERERGIEQALNYKIRDIKTRRVNA